MIELVFGRLHHNSRTRIRAGSEFKRLFRFILIDVSCFCAHQVEDHWSSSASLKLLVPGNHYMGHWAVTIFRSAVKSVRLHFY
jgi:hypothetical protein